jgi:multidrug efflux pump subunit AcrA (membrane-fusion protein)
MPRHATLVTACVAALLMLAYAVRQSFPADEATALQAPVDASRPSQPAAGRVAGTGLIEPAGEAITLTPPVGGVVATLRVKPGDQVRRGDLLLTLETGPVMAEQHLRAAAEQTAWRSLETAEEELREKAALLALYRGLEGSDAWVPEEQLRRESAWRLARARVSAARAGVAEAHAAVLLAGARTAQHVLRAPADAWVLQVRSQPGEWVQPGGTAPVTLARTGPLQVRVDVDEADVARLAEGAPASILARGDRTPVPARFVRAEPLLTPKRNLSNANDERVDTRVLQLLFELPANAAGFRVGQQVDAFMAAKAAQASVPAGKSVAP